MKRSHRILWFWFGAGTVAALAALAAMSVIMLRLESESAHVRSRESALRVALWRMDSWLSPQLAREAARPHFEYQPYYAAESAYTQLLSEIPAGQVLTPSPLLTFESTYFPIHFQIQPDGTVTSPQVPEGNHLDLAESTVLPPGAIDRRRALLERVRGLINLPQVEMACSVAEKQILAQIESSMDQVQTQTAQEMYSTDDAEQTRSYQEMQKRVSQNWTAQIEAGLENKGKEAALAPSSVAEVSALAPIWARAIEGEGGEVELLFVRRVTMNGTVVYQGFLAQWDQLRAMLLAQVNDLFTAARLAPLMDGPAARGEEPEADMLAAIPAVLDGAEVSDESLALLTPARLALGITWLAVLGAVAAAGMTLRASIDYADRRSRFASAVTHELRTPLTTFELYAGMLAEGMVKDPAKAREYHITLRDEAERLSAIVENVLAYAQVEEGRLARTPQKVSVRDAVSHVLPALQRRAEKCSAMLDVQIDDAEGATWSIDVETIGQILFNLIDNACKYGCPKARSRIELNASVRDGRAEFCVRDFGDGVPARMETRIFEPFDRGALSPGSIAPGVGIGLTLSRDLARAMGGDLSTRAQHGEAGASFVLRLPLRE